MKAIVVRQFGGPEVLRLEDIEKPTFGSSDVLVRVHAAGVNPVDAYIRTGTYSRKPALPYTPGLDGAGTVEAVGSSVQEFKSGDRVYIASDNQSVPSGGTYEEMVTCAPTMLHRLPDRVTFGQGAALGVPYVTAYRALFMKADARPGETALVHGATGGVGIAAVQMAHAHGMTVIGTGGTDRGRKAVREHGADFVLNHREANHQDEIMKVTGGRGVDVVLEMAAHINLEKDLSVLARFGRIIVIGSRGRIEIEPRQILARDAKLIGMTLFNATPADLATAHAAIVAGLSTGTLKPIVGREMPLAEAPAAHHDVLEPGAFGKIVLIP